MISLLFVTDVHGSERCFLKLLNAWKYHPVQVIILGGDITGKAIVPIVRDSSGKFNATFMDREVHLDLESEVEALEKSIRFNGFYPFRTDPEEMVSLKCDPAGQKALFSRLILQQIERWEQFADDRLRGSGVKCYVIPGNDDIHEIDDLLNQGKSMVNVDGRAVEIAPHWVMVSAGYSNCTPWHGPREFNEEEIANRIASMLAMVPNDVNLIFNFHCPPINSGIDTVQKIDNELRPVYDHGHPVLVSGGSKAVREAIECWTPLLGLHGHIHESKGLFRWKRTLAINPGSEYASGVLKGVVVSLGISKVEAYMFLEA